MPGLFPSNVALLAGAEVNSVTGEATAGHSRLPLRKGTAGFYACRPNADQGRAADQSGQDGIERRAPWIS
jgi:hypothetical protein